MHGAWSGVVARGASGNHETPEKTRKSQGSGAGRVGRRQSAAWRSTGIARGTPCAIPGAVAREAAGGTTEPGISVSGTWPRTRESKDRRRPSRKPRDPRLLRCYNGRIRGDPAAPDRPQDVVVCSQALRAMVGQPLRAVRNGCWCVEGCGGHCNITRVVARRGAAVAG